MIRFQVEHNYEVSPSVRYCKSFQLLPQSTHIITRQKLQHQGTPKTILYSKDNSKSISNHHTIATHWLFTKNQMHTFIMSAGCLPNGIPSSTQLFFYIRMAINNGMITRDYYSKGVTYNQVNIFWFFRFLSIIHRNLGIVRRIFSFSIRL